MLDVNNNRIKKREIQISIIGLGFVGIPLAHLFLMKKFKVWGIDVDSNKIYQLKQGICPIKTYNIDFKSHIIKESFVVSTEFKDAIRNAGVHIICVPTELIDATPNLVPFKSACSEIGKHIKKGDLVIVQSSVSPGTCDEIGIPIIEDQSGLNCGKDFGFVFCPERIDPGNKKNTLENTPRVMGGINTESIEACETLLKTIIKPKFYITPNIKTAEFTKLFENTYRDVNIAFVNEMALLCSKLDIDILEVLNAAKTKWNYIPYIPGSGVGGSCIPVNPQYLINKAEQYDTRLPLTMKAREINENMPNHIMSLVHKGFNRIDKKVSGSKITILGLAYKPNISDTRRSTSFPIISKLEDEGASVFVYDPHVKHHETLVLCNNIEDSLVDSDCVIINTAHDLFFVDFEDAIKSTSKPLVLIDGRNVLKPELVASESIHYYGIGRTTYSRLNIKDINGN